MASFRKKGSGWTFRVAYKDENGKTKQKERGGFKTKKEAQIAAAEMERRFLYGDDLQSGELLFETYFERWFKKYREGKYSIENDKIYLNALNVIKKYFPDTKIKNVTREKYQDFINDYGATRSYETVRKINGKIVSCLIDAQHDGAIAKLPSHRVTLVGEKGKQEEQKYLDEDEVKRLIAAVEKNIQPSYASSYMILLAIATGARFAELLGLTEDCIDFVHNTIKINKTWDYKFTKNFSTTKNESSMRTVSVDQHTMDHLKFFIDSKKIKPLNKLIFTDSTLTPISSNAVNKALKKALKRANIDKEEFTFHGLRHTHGSILLLHDASILYVSKRLGHSGIDTTMKVYSHLVKELAEKGNNISNMVINDLYG